MGNFRKVSGICVLLLLAACKGYDVTINDRVVHSPTPLFSDFQLADERLQRCVEQHIQDQQVRSPGALKTLACTHAGISSLAGLNLFAGLEVVQLDNNQIEDVSVLGNIPTLRQLYLRNNQVKDAGSLVQLSNLQELDLVANDELNCDNLAGLQQRLSNRLRLPRHCAG